MLDGDLINLLTTLTALTEELPWLEFKVGTGSITNEQIGEYISALSNGAAIANKPFGYIIWGIQDKTHLWVGTDFNFSKAKQGNQDLELWLRNLLSPKINFEIFETDVEKKHFVIIRIPSATGEPVAFKNHPFVRIGSNKTSLSRFPQYMKLIYNRTEDWSSKIVSEASIFDLDPEAIKIAREKFAEKHKNPPLNQQISDLDDISFLNKAKITIDGKITNTALILLGKPESSHFLLPAIMKITWKLETDEKAYEHFETPMLLTTTKVLNRIRNTKYKFFPDNVLLSVEVEKYNSRVILEALHNCIAHQDYSYNQRIILTEKTDRLIFVNGGNFFEGKPEDYTGGAKTPSAYRNTWLSNAMVNLNMIDTLGYGIHTMYLEQRKRYFPLPDYDLSDPEKVTLSIYGQVINENYSKQLIQRNDISLEKVILLDRFQKKLTVPEKMLIELKKDGLLEGRRPNYFISSLLATSQVEKVSYIKHKAFDDEHYKDMISAFLAKFDKGTRKDFESLIIDKLSDVLTLKQKKDKVKNLLQSLRLDKKIYLDGKNWKSVK
jgi:ATP-dependent DNA helicase RecG